MDLIERKSLIIFDEVQFCPKARQAIKTLVKDHRYDYLETGSLISIRKNVQNILIPSEEDRITMHPMDYEEFLNACGDQVTIPILRKFFDEQRSLGDQTNRKMMRDFRLYMLVGGMPQAVAEYQRTNNLRKVDEVKIWFTQKICGKSRIFSVSRCIWLNFYRSNGRDIGNGSNVSRKWTLRTVISMSC